VRGAALGTALFFTACYWAPEKNQKNAQIMAGDKKRKKRLIGPCWSEGDFKEPHLLSA
jgi:hypothetical protein